MGTQELAQNHCHLIANSAASLIEPPWCALAAWLLLACRDSLGGFAFPVTQPGCIQLRFLSRLIGGDLLPSLLALEKVIKKWSYRFYLLGF